MLMTMSDSDLTTTWLILVVMRSSNVF